MNNQKSLDDSFEEWMYKVEEIIYKKLEFKLDDLPDEQYRINYDEGITPQDMGKIIISNYNNMFYF